MVVENAQIIEQLGRRYDAGFVTDIESDSLPPGLSEDIIRALSAIKNEPVWMTEWRLAAYRHWLTMPMPHWARLNIAPIDFQALSYYSAPKAKYATLADVPRPIDMVEIFRNSEAAGPITDEALRLDPLPNVIWMQLSVRNDEAAARAEAKGIRVIMNRCPKIEFGRLSGEIGWQGVNSRVLSAKKPMLAGKGFQKFSIRT